MRLLITLFAAGLCTAAACSTPSTQAPSKPVLASASGTLNISSKPSNAIVILDGKPVGRTPLTIRRKVGSHAIVLQRNGQNYGPHLVNVDADKPASLDVSLKVPQAKVAPKRRLTASERYRAEQNRLGACFPDGWAGSNPPEYVIAEAVLNDSGRLVRLTMKDARAGYGIAQCVEKVLRPRYEHRRFVSGIDKTTISIKILL